MVSKFLGSECGATPALCREASPVHRISPGAPPYLIMHGTADQTVPYSQAADMTAKLKTAGVSVELFTAESAPHTFWANPRWSAETLDAMERFLRELSGYTSPQTQNGLGERSQH
jgi:dipeptidyl aminopeptidase/acylaminoacyl peptidase